MSLGGPNIYPGVGLWLGISRELTVDDTPEIPEEVMPNDNPDAS